MGEQYRFYWNTPFILSPHNPSTVYLGGERLFKSTDRGDTWTMTKDLTRNISRFERPILGVGGMEPMASKHDGAASYSNIVTIGESYVVPGVLWVGTNDGNVQVSRDGGSSWKNVTANAKGVPDETHVSRVEPSHFEAGTAYVTFDGHRTNDHKPYVFKTTDFGETFTSISSNLPEGNVNVIREDPKNRNLLYLGTEYAFYVSLDGGKEWKRFMNGLPTVRIDDVMVHPRDNDLILGDARQEYLDHRRHHPAAADVSGRDDESRGDPVRRPSGRPVAHRYPEVDHSGGGEALPRPESRAGDGDQLLAEERAGRRRQDHHQRRAGQRSP